MKNNNYQVMKIEFPYKNLKEINIKNNDRIIDIDIDIINRLTALEEELKEVKEELKVIQEQSVNINDKVIEDYSGMNTLQPKDSKSNLNQISYRYNIGVLEKLNKLCEMYPHTSKTRILNTLLDEIIDKYLNI